MKGFTFVIAAISAWLLSGCGLPSAPSDSPAPRVPPPTLVVAYERPAVTYPPELRFDPSYMGCAHHHGPVNFKLQTDWGGELRLASTGEGRYTGEMAGPAAGEHQVWMYDTFLCGSVLAPNGVPSVTSGLAFNGVPLVRVVDVSRAIGKGLQFMMTESGIVRP